DYNLTNAQIKQSLKTGDEVEKKWLVGKILTHARFDDVWRYLSLKEVVSAFNNLRISSQTRKMWASALKVWGYNV
ncbi:hypothetical protein COT50_02700, partial [candidate division WWE3 bacterium CG08_land_8_20_14_0_20_41_10]